jgi:Cu/Ag efflux pump CusA
MEIGLHHVFPIVIALLTLWVAISFAIRPTEHKLAILRPLALSLVFAVLALTFAGFANLLAALKRVSFPEGKDSVGLLLGGLSEGLIPGIVGFAVLAVSWALAAFGLKRQV